VPPLVSTIATTSTGAVDHLAEIADVAKDFPTLFIHIDAAVSAIGKGHNAEHASASQLN
jgi:glutamate/tyrosine decarboxylase-like PLP-dependent enzyme